MAFCSNCGAEFEGKFCPKCGTPASDAQAPPPQQGQPVGQQTPVAPAQPVAAGGMTDNVAATLCYVLGFITGIIFLVLAPYNKNKLIRFHAFQSIFVSVSLFVLSMAVSIILPWSLSLVLDPLISLGGFVLWIFLLIKTYQNQKIVLPIVGPLAEKQA